MSRGISPIKAAVGLVVVLGFVVGGAYAIGVLGTPTVTDVENRFADVDDESTTIDTELAVDNPNVFGIHLGGVTVNYTVELNEVRLAGGSKEGVRLPSGNSTLTFRTTMTTQRIPEWWVAHIRAGESSELVVNARVHSSTLGRSVPFTPDTREVSTDLLSAFNADQPRPVNANQPVVADPILYINETEAQWGTVSTAETPIQMRFRVYNPKSTPFTITTLGYEVTMNGIPVGSGETQQGATIPPKTHRTIEAVTVIRNGELASWWVSHLERNQVTDLEIDFYARIELPGGQTVRVPLDALTYTERMETDIFGTKNGTDGSTGQSTPTASDGPTPEGNDGGTTVPTTTGSTTTGEETSPTETAEPGSPTPTETGTETETETETEDGDGGLLG